MIAGSRIYRNGDAALDMELDAEGRVASLGPRYAELRDAIGRAMANVPGDDTRVILFGSSGGGSVSHALSLAYPGLADALIVCSGMMWGDTIIGPNDGESGPFNGPPWNEYADRRTADLRAAFAVGGSRRLAAMLESPTDFRYEEMLADAGRLRNLGRGVEQFEFPGGHVLAPAAVFERAAAWLVGRAAWG